MKTDSNEIYRLILGVRDARVKRGLAFYAASSTQWRTAKSVRESVRIDDLRINPALKAVKKAHNQ